MHFVQEKYLPKLRLKYSHEPINWLKKMFFLFQTINCFALEYSWEFLSLQNARRKDCITHLIHLICLCLAFSMIVIAAKQIVAITTNSSRFFCIRSCCFWVSVVIPTLQVDLFHCCMHVCVCAHCSYYIY